MFESSTKDREISRNTLLDDSTTTTYLTIMVTLSKLYVSLIWENKTDSNSVIKSNFLTASQGLYFCAFFSQPLKNLSGLRSKAIQSMVSERLKFDGLNIEFRGIL